MELRKIPVTKKSKDYKEIKALLKRAFPRYEQNPMWLLNHWAKKDGIDFYSYYDNDTMCGFSFTVSKNNTVFVMYLAVSDKIRSKGYGSAIISQLKSLFPEKEIVLNIEPLTPQADNYEQRVRRFAFYERNGFYDTETTIQIGKNDFTVLSTKKVFDKETYAAILKKLSFGLYNPKFKRV